MPGLDSSLFRCVQIHYTAAPIFEGDVDDPCTDGRLAILPGYPEVEVPELPEQQRRATFAPVSIGQGRPGPRRGLRTGLLTQPRARTRGPASCDLRRRQSCRLLALAKAGEIDATRVAAMIKGVMFGKGFDGRSGRDLSEIVSILQWAWDTVEPEELPHGR